MKNFLGFLGLAAIATAIFSLNYTRIFKKDTRNNLEKKRWWQILTPFAAGAVIIHLIAGMKSMAAMYTTLLSVFGIELFFSRHRVTDWFKKQTSNPKTHNA